MRQIICFFMLLTSVFSFGQQHDEAIIEQAVIRQMQLHPKSTLRDLYKSFFQDRFGPGHIIADTTSAGRYLRQELESEKQFRGVLFEPTGYHGNFYRVNLSIIKNGEIDYDTFFKAFVKSVNGIKAITIEEWKAEWKKINAVIVRVVPNLDGYEKDNTEINALLQSGKYAMHHSKQFNEAYNLHYRIIDKATFEKEIMPKILK